jgi:hypothetical protein
VVPYDRKNMPQSTKLAFRRIAHSVASAMWKALDLFGGPVKEFFTNQFQPMNCIPIGLDAYPTQVHQLHMSKNSFIKPHIDKLDFESFFSRIQIILFLYYVSKIHITNQLLYIQIK